MVFLRSLHTPKHLFQHILVACSALLVGALATGCSNGQSEDDGILVDILTISQAQQRAASGPQAVDRLSIADLKGSWNVVLTTDTVTPTPTWPEGVVDLFETPVTQPTVGSTQAMLLALQTRAEAVSLWTAVGTNDGVGSDWLPTVPALDEAALGFSLNDDAFAWALNLTYGSQIYVLVIQGTQVTEQGFVGTFTLDVARNGASATAQGSVTATRNTPPVNAVPWTVILDVDTLYERLTATNG